MDGIIFAGRKIMHAGVFFFPPHGFGEIGPDGFSVAKTGEGVCPMWYQDANISLFPYFLPL